MDKTNIISFEERKNSSNHASPIKRSRIRLEVENMKVMVTTSIISLVALVTLANSTMLNGQEDASLAAPGAGRGLASVSTGTSEVEDALVSRLSKMELSQSAVVGRKPSKIEKLSLGLLEGRYAVLLHNGRLHGLELVNPADNQPSPKNIEDRLAFIESNRDLLPVDFKKSVKRDVVNEGSDLVETYQLLGKDDFPVAHIQFRLNGEGGLVSMKVTENKIASN